MNNKLKTLRISAGLSQRQLSALTGMKQQYIQRYEKGEFKPKLENLVKIAKALNKPITDLLEEDF